MEDSKALDSLAEDDANMDGAYLELESSLHKREGTYCNWDRDTKKRFVESFCSMKKVGANYAFTCKFCGKETKGQYLTALVHISGLKQRNGIRAAPCSLSIDAEEGLQIQNQVRSMFETEDDLYPSIKKRKIAITSTAEASDSAIDFAHMLPATFKETVRNWLKDDCPTTDIGGFVVGEKMETANLFCKSSTIVAGVPFALAAFEYMGLTCDWKVPEGTFVDVSEHGGKLVVATVHGKCRNILLAERVALNILSRASGIATAARKVVQIKESCKWQGYVASTRKTTPGFKDVEKYAVVVGGAATHRMDLSQMVMLKDNHIWSAGSITSAVHKARRATGFSMKIEVECQSVEEALEASAGGADIVMLDNFTQETIGEAAGQVKEQFPHVLIEASGGITQDTLAAFMSPNVDVISMGALTQGYSCADFSLKIAH